MRSRGRAIAALLALALLAAACGGGGDEGGSGDTITVWTLENLADRVQAQQKINQRFTQSTGIKVNLVGVGEDQFRTLITSASAAGKLPDVIGALPLSLAHSIAADELVDTEVAEDVVNDLGADTFSKRALDLYRADGALIGVPSDAWTQLLVYRKDLFEKAGQPVPDSLEKIRSAAAALNKGGTAGITAATVPDDPFTEQTFEYFALANGCQLVDQGGTVTLDSGPCVDTFRFYTDLIRSSSVRGNQDVDSTRATYFAGKAAMLVWSSFILDELAGLRKDALPSCAQCKGDRGFLAENSGVVTALQGPGGARPAQYGEIVSWVISSTANTAAAKRYVQYLMSDGYVDWLAMAPEGKFPVRNGTSANPQQYAQAWDGLKAGVDRKEPLKDVYPPEVLDALRKSTDTMDRWGLPQGQGKLLGATVGELPVPKALSSSINGQLDPPAAAKKAKADVESLAKSLK